MKICLKTFAILAAILLSAHASHATIIQVGSWALGEAGSTNGGGAQAQPYVALVDTVGTANNITAYQNGGSNPSLATTGLAAPGSTAAIAKTVASSSSGWHSNSNPFGLTNDWAFEIWVRPDANNGTILLQTDNSTSGISVWAQNGGDGNGTDLAFAHGSGGTANPTSGNLFDYTVGTWYRIDIIRYNGTNNYYIGGNLLATDALSGLLNAPMLAFATGGVNGTQAAFDEMRAWTFDHNLDSLQSVENVVFGVPEPNSFVILLAGSVGLWLVRRKRAS